MGTASKSRLFLEYTGRSDQDTSLIKQIISRVCLLQVVLAVLIVVVSQASGSPGHGYGYGYGPTYSYVGPLADNGPGGVADKYTLEAARGKFFQAYHDQLNTIFALRARGHGSHGYGGEHH